MAFKLKSPFNAYMDDADATKLKQAQHSKSYTGPKGMITADGINTQLTQDDKITTVGGDNPFSGYSKDSFKKKDKNGDDTPVPTDAEMKNTFDQFLFDNKEELDKLEQDAKDAKKRKQPLYPSEKVQKRTTTSMRNPKDQLVDIDKYRNQPNMYNIYPEKMKKKQLSKTGAGKAHNMSALQYNQEQLMSNLSGAGDQPSKEDLDAMKALLSMQNNQGMSSSPMNMKSYSDQRMRQMDNLNASIQKIGESMQGSPMNNKSLTKVVGELHKASKMHKAQAQTIDAHIKEMKESPVKNDVRKMKRAAKKEDKAKIKAKRKEGTLDSSDFANQSYRTLKGKF